MTTHVRPLGLALAAASAALEWAADLSVHDGDRARRLAAAADAAWRGGNTARASDLLDRAEPLGGLDTSTRVEIHHVLGSVEIRVGSPEVGARLLAAAAGRGDRA